jgi:GTPase SAR1 family protein
LKNAFIHHKVKSETVRGRSASNYHPPNVATDGITIDEWEVDGIKLNCFDFGGQEVYYPTHQFFTSGINS